MLSAPEADFFDSAFSVASDRPTRVASVFGSMPRSVKTCRITPTAEIEEGQPV